VGCLRCQSSSSAKYSVKALPDYQLVCTAYGQTWQQIHIPTTTATTTIQPTSTGVDLPSGVTNPGDITSHSGSGLSNGAIAGIIVSVVALIVALSVAGYVWGRRRRLIVEDDADLD